ncbi:MAG: hypothetical protein COA79_12230 [Planctomycetota bacterium]|nr:MAG: hypothetical protein COA79_12230 [Planctomycetota bacterium]
MSKIKIATCQFPISKDIAKNKTYILKYVIEAGKKKVRLIHFSETCLSGYGGSDWHDKKDVDWILLKEATIEIMEMAKKYKIWVVLGSSHPLTEKKLPHNCLYVINDKGKIVDRYDKRFCTGGDLKCYAPGDHFTTFKVDGVKFGLLICYDVRFPELYREYLKLNVDCVLHSFYNANLINGSIHDIIMHPNLQCRAATNHMYVIGNNNSKRHQCWPSLFIDPDGKIRKKLIKHKAGLLIDTIDLKKDFYDAGGNFKYDAMNGKLNSGTTVKDKRSKDLKCL